MAFQKGHKTNIGNKNHLGFHHSDEAKRKIGLTHKGKQYCLGRKMSEETKKKISETLKRKGIEPKVKFIGRGEKHWAWKKDRTQLCRTSKQGERRTSVYFNWRKQVWIRDNYKCRMHNQDCCGRIEAHHILGFTKYPELRYEINNGITLCQFHHPKKRVDEERLSPYFQELVTQLNG